MHCVKQEFCCKKSLMGIVEFVVLFKNAFMKQSVCGCVICLMQIQVLNEKSFL